MATTIGSGSGTLASLIPDLTDVSNIQTALKQLYYGTVGGTLSTTTGIYGALYTLYTGNPTLSGSVTITGNLTVNGSTTTINSTTLTVDDKNIELASVASPTDVTADGAGITVKGATDKTWNWVDATDSWTSNQDINIVSTGTALRLAGTVILDTNAPKSMARLMGYTSTATAAGTTTLTNTSSYYQQFTGSTTQTVVLPLTSTLITGWTFHIVNNSTANLTVNSSGGNLVITVIPGTTAMVTCINTGVTDATGWEAGLTDFSTYTGTGNNVMATSPTITTPVIDTINTSLTTSGTATLWNTGITTGTISIGGALTTGAINIGSGTAGAKTITIGTSTGTVTVNGTANIGKALIQTVTTTAGASTLTFSSIPQTYKSLEVEYTVGTASTSATTLSIQFSSDTATNYTYAFQQYTGTSTTNTSAASSYANGFDQVSILVPMNHPENTAIGSFSIDNYASTSGSKIGRYDGYYNYISDAICYGTFAWKNRTTAVTSILLTFNGTVTGQIVTAKLFGLN